IAVCSAALATSSAMADSIDVRFLGTGSGQNVKINLNGSAQTVFAGQLRHELTNGVGIGAALEGTWVTFCIDLANHVTNSAQTYGITDIATLPVPAMGEARAQAVADMYAYASGAQTAAGAANALAAAFQV